jgi:hypothetical protein
MNAAQRAAQGAQGRAFGVCTIGEASRRGATISEALDVCGVGA